MTKTREYSLSHDAPNIFNHLFTMLACQSLSIYSEAFARLRTGIHAIITLVSYFAKRTRSPESLVRVVEEGDYIPVATLLTREWFLH